MQSIGILGPQHSLASAVDYRIIQKHGGYIRVNSEVNVGTEFIVELPVHLLGERYEALRAADRR